IMRGSLRANHQQWIQQSPGIPQPVTPKSCFQFTDKQAKRYIAQHLERAAGRLIENRFKHEKADITERASFSASPF
ncbi:hypothetical protein BZY71_12325, partial [Leclercia adecarboxylata]|uniref:hypothetical protein n=1 Tax=Leclercia adecarboxylata TaxID=83655 RepID=UPI0009CCD65F